MNTKILSSCNVQTSFLGNLTKELLEVIFLDTNHLGVISRCREVCKAFKIFVEEKKLFERFLSADTQASRRLLQDFYHFEYEAPFIQLIYSLHRLVKLGKPYPHMRELVANHLINDKILFINDLNIQFRLRAIDSTSNYDPDLTKLLLFANDPNQQVYTEARRLLLQLITDASTPLFLFQLNEDQRRWIKNACENTFDIRRGIFDVVIWSIGCLALDFFSNNRAGPMSVYLIFVVLGFYSSAEAISKYVQYGHSDPFLQTTLTILITMSLAILRNLLF